MTDAITIARERPDQPDVMRLIEALDAHAIALYPPESNHLLDIVALCDPAVTFLVVKLLPSRMRSPSVSGRLRST